jgi:hypothetical protein
VLWVPDTFLECEIELPEAVECNSHGVRIGSSVTGGIAPLQYRWIIDGEKCFIQSGQNTPEIVIYVGWSEVSITLEVTDAYGCITICQAVLTCENDFINLVQPEDGEPESDVSAEQKENSVHSIEVEDLSGLQLWPNPVSDAMYVSFTADKAREVNLRMTNVLGNTVIRHEMKSVEGYNQAMLDVDQLPEGTYILFIESEDELYSRKFVISRK